MISIYIEKMEKEGKTMRNRRKTKIYNK